MKSKFLNLDIKDAINGFVVAFLSAALTGLVATLDSGALPTVTELKSAGIIGLTAGLSYLLKNVLTNSNGELLKKEA
jgi:VIT1/CCC1 family predicted Fe2+/Mn2+ transporter